MIREAAALKLARDLLQPYLERDMATEPLVTNWAKFIQQCVEIDELNQEIERLTKGDDDGKRETGSHAGTGA